MIRSDASEVFALADDLLDTSRKSIPAAREAVREAGEVVEKAWQNAARRTHDSHAKFYPESITSELLPGFSTISAEIGPETHRKQGFLGRILEFGGEKSPAYLLGASALADNEGRIERVIAQSMDPLFP